MVITLVMDQFGESNNGTTITAMRFAEVLKKQGHTVKVLTASKIEAENVFVLPEWKMPFFHRIVRKQGMKFAEPNIDIMRKAIEGSDVVHMLMPFKAQNAAYKIAEEMHIATTAAFHVQPENFTYSVGLGNNRLANKIIYTFFRKTFYHKFNHIHCPSQMMKDLLLENKYSGQIHAISNGVSEEFKKTDAVKPEKYSGKFVILMIGRYSKEKRQDLIIKAIGASKYNDKIQLILAGKGPTKKKLQKLSDKFLANPVEFIFEPKLELINVINYSDLYVHSSDAESEAISCIEAFSCGLVPIISDSKICATKQFALSPRNLFRRGNFTDLKDKIEWLMENREEYNRLSLEYMEYGKEFALENCVNKLVEVFEMAIAENFQRWKNVADEDAYLKTLTQKQTREYAKDKKKFLRELKENNKPDFINSFILTKVN